MPSSIKLEGNTCCMLGTYLLDSVEVEMAVIKFMVAVCLVIGAVWAILVQEKIVEWVRSGRTPDELQAEVTGKRRNKKQTKQSTGNKFVEFWKSNPLWWVLGMLSAIALQHLPLVLSFIALWIVLTVEIVRLEFFSQRWRLLGNGFVSVIFAVLLCVGSIVAPPPAMAPTLDQQTNAFFAMLSKKAPWLVSPPEPQPVVIRSNQTATAHFTWEELHAVNGALFMSLQPVPVVFHYTSDDDTAHDVYIDATVEIITRPDTAAVATSMKAFREAEAKEEKAFHGFRQMWLSKSYWGEGHDLQKNEQQFFVGKSRALDQWKDVPDLLARREFLYVMGAVKWRDDTGTYETDLCSFYEGMDGVINGERKIVWTQCLSGHSQVRRVFDPSKD
jgi:hypothetical protein